MSRKGFTLKDLIYISLLATIATVSKVPIRTLSIFLSGTVGLPGGVVGGVYYMFWIVAVVGIVRKKGTATLFCIVQIFVTLVTSSMPIIKLITYIPPGIAIDLFLLIRRRESFSKGTMMILGALANCAGAATQALFIMGLPIIPTLVSVGTAAISGAVGGYLAFVIVIQLNRTIVFN